jgi:hypothetical protein
MAGSPLLTRVRNRAARLRQRRWRMEPYHSTEHHIVMGGAPRSGTTVLRKLLDRHPQVRSGAETKLFVPAAFNPAWLAQSYGIALADVLEMQSASPSQAAFVDAFAQRVRRDAGKERWAEKTPQNIRHLDWIMARFPDASIVHIVRDARDVVCSMRQHPDWRWIDGTWQKVLVARPLAFYARRWLEDVRTGLAWRGDPRYTEVRYESLVADPAAALAMICRGIGASVDSDWLASVGRRDDEDAQARRPDYEGAVSGASVGRWRSDLSVAEQQEVERLCGPQLRELGYEG